MGARPNLQKPDFFTEQDIDAVADAIRARVPGFVPRVGLILGSGLGAVAEAASQVRARIPYAELPDWPEATVKGHAGRLILGEWAGQPIMLMQGRAHYYEGYTMAQIGLPIRVMRRLGVEVLIVTNAAGAVNPDFAPGDLMLLQDHINFMGMAGLSPLRGPNLDSFGPRFPDMGRAYDPELRALARRVAEAKGIEPLWEGVYVSVAGPQFETPADLRFLRLIGVDAVGMSTVPEVVTAVHSGMRVLGISGISNRANLDGKTTTTHEEVLEAGKRITPRMAALIEGVLAQLAFDA
ncbi:MAG: purine-nucleoside phosphorylase [Chloroflexi bacterium]|nr:purine-nucleoside phosphorylase [Chloroflexota bacterium]